MKTKIKKISLLIITTAILLFQASLTYASGRIYIGILTDTTSPVLAEVTPIGTTTDTTPSYTFSSTEAGTITYGGSCSSSTTNAIVGDNTIVFDELEIGTYNDCTITVTDSNSNVSTPLIITLFVIEKNHTVVVSGSIPTGYIDNEITENITVSIPKGKYISPLDNEIYDCTPFTKYLRFGLRTNDPHEAKLWQAFLNKYENENLKIDGVYGLKTESAIKRFQNKYKNQILVPWGLTHPTGYTYKSTRAYGNKIIGCPEGNVKLDNGVVINDGVIVS